MVIARRIHGHYRQVKERLSLLLLFIFFALPFIPINGRPALLLNIAERRFYVFGLAIWPQDLFLLNLLLIFAGLLLFFFTAWRGRIFCAYGCPQSVLTDLYDWVGRRVAGENFGKRSWTLSAKVMVHLAWLLTSLTISFVFISYFVGIKDLWSHFYSGQFLTSAGGAPAGWMFFWLGFAGFAYIVWGHFRENVCNYVCPYGRFQTALMDKGSPIVVYDQKRGEPRRKKGQRDYDGDCTACSMCVLTCPTGIDIRDGLQIGCIRCGLCIDACTKEMGRKNKQTLIDFGAFEDEAKGFWARPRIIVYGALILFVTVLLSVFIYNKSSIYLSVFRQKTGIGLFVPGIGYQNIYELKIGNKADYNRDLQIDLQTNEEGFAMLTNRQQLKLDKEKQENISVIVRYKTDQRPRPAKAITFRVTDSNTGETVEADTVFSF